MRRILVTSALPYVNADIHIGHLLEDIQTDIWVRFQKLIGNRCVYMCADDTHGTAMMIRARQEGRSEEELIAEVQAAHERDFAGFDIEFDNYGSTHSEENRALCDEFWRAIRKAGLVKERDVEQLYDPQAGTFLADRFVRGTCPKCESPDQPGDNCSKCGHHYSPTELIDPRSTLSGATPEVRTSPHLFIELEKLHGFLEEWTQSGEHLQPEIANYLKGHFLGEPLRDWDISRPAPYFGFEIPDSPGNYWYVWFDAPIGYMASTQQWCDRTGEKFDDWWRSPRYAKSTTSSARTSRTSTRCSGPACSRRPATACRRRSTSTAFSPSAARRCRRARARSSPRGRTSIISTRASCATSTPRSCRRASKTSIWRPTSSSPR